MKQLAKGPNEHSSVPAAHAPYPSVSKENVQTSRAWQPSNMYALLSVRQTRTKVREMLSSNIVRVRWSWSFNRDRITGNHLSATISWPEHCQERRSMPVTASLHHQHSVGKTNRSPIAHRSFDLTYHYFQNLFFYTFKLSFELFILT